MDDEPRNYSNFSVYNDDDDVKKYLRDMGKFPMFSNVEEKFAGEKMRQARACVISALAVARNSINRDVRGVRKILKSCYNLSDCQKSNRQRQKILYKTDHFWKFIAKFIFEFKKWPSSKDTEEQFGKISKRKLKIVDKLRCEVLRDETNLRLYLEREVPFTNETVLKKKFPALYEQILLRIFNEWRKKKCVGCQAPWKYWQARVFDELSELQPLPKNLSLATEDLVYHEQKFMEANLRLVVSIAKNYFGMCSESKLTFLDLIQWGNIGLSKATRRFDPSMGFRFSTFATLWVKQYIQRAIENDSNTIRMPVHVTGILKKLNKLSLEIFHETGVEPTIEELALKIKKRFPDAKNLNNMTFQKIKNIFDGSREVYSLDQKIDQESEDSDSFGDFIEDTKIPSPYEKMLENNLKNGTRRVIRRVLNQKEARIVELRFGLDDGVAHTLEEISEEFELTRERIRQLEKRAIAKLRNPATKAMLRQLF